MSKLLESTQSLTTVLFVRYSVCFDSLSDPNPIKAAQHMKAYHRWERLTMPLNGAPNWGTTGTAADQLFAEEAMRSVFAPKHSMSYHSITCVQCYYYCKCGTGAHFNRSSLYCPIDRLLANDFNDRYTTKSLLYCINNKFNSICFTIESILLLITTISQ